MGAVVSLLVEQFRQLLSVGRIRLLVLVISFAFVYVYRLDALASVGLITPHRALALVFNALLVAGAAKVANDGVNLVDRMGDK